MTTRTGYRRCALRHIIQYLSISLSLLASFQRQMPCQTTISSFLRIGSEEASNADVIRVRSRIHAIVGRVFFAWAAAALHKRRLKVVLIAKLGAFGLESSLFLSKAHWHQFHRIFVAASTSALPITTTWQIAAVFVGWMGRGLRRWLIRWKRGWLVRGHRRWAC